MAQAACCLIFAPEAFGRAGACLRVVPAASCRLASCEVGGSRILGREFGHLAPASSGVRRIVTPVQSASHIQGHRYDRFPRRTSDTFLSRKCPQMRGEGWGLSACGPLAWPIHSEPLAFIPRGVVMERPKAEVVTLRRTQSFYCSLVAGEHAPKKSLPKPRQCATRTLGGRCEKLLQDTRD